MKEKRRRMCKSLFGWWGSASKHEKAKYVEEMEGEEDVEALEETEDVLELLRNLDEPFSEQGEPAMVMKTSEKTALVWMDRGFGSSHELKVDLETGEATLATSASQMDYGMSPTITTIKDINKNEHGAASIVRGAIAWRNFRRKQGPTTPEECKEQWERCRVI